MASSFLFFFHLQIQHILRSKKLSHGPHGFIVSILFHLWIWHIFRSKKSRWPRNLTMTFWNFEAVSPEFLRSVSTVAESCCTDNVRSFLVWRNPTPVVPAQSSGQGMSFILVSKNQHWTLARSKHVTCVSLQLNDRQLKICVTRLRKSSGKFDANLFYLMSPYFYLKSKLSKFKQISVKEVFLKNKEIYLG